jgi:hypothetical protein
MMTDQLIHDVLLNLFRLSTGALTPSMSALASRPALRLQPLDVILSRLVAALAPTRIGQFANARMLHAVEVAGRSTEATDLDNAVELVGKTEALLRSVNIDLAILQRIKQAVDDIDVLAATIRLNHLTDVLIHISQPAFFDYMAELRFQSPDQHGHVLIIGRPYEDSLHIEGFSEPRILRQLKLTYRTAQLEPELTPHNLQLGLVDKAVERREHWFLRDGPRSDLLAYQRFSGQPLLRIETRVLTEARVIALGDISLQLPAFDMLKLIVTSITRTAQTAAPDKPPLASYIRAF